MENLFTNVSDEELKLYWEQYKEWQKTCIIPDNELGKLRDIYCQRSST